MGDPTGVSGVIISKLLDQVIDMTKKTINCRQYCKALENLLENIRPLVTVAATRTDRYMDASGTVLEGPRVVQRWLKDLEGKLTEAHSLVLECNERMYANYNVLARNRMSNKILDITKQIQEIMMQAPLAVLNIMESTIEAVMATNQSLDEGLARLENNLNMRAVGDTTQLVLQIEEIQPGLAFQEIKNVTDILALNVHRDGQAPTISGSSQHKRDVDDVMSSNILRPVPELNFIFGMDVPLAKLQGLLLGENMRWVGIWGKGGIGKSLLADRACNSKIVQDHFQKTFWLTVGNNPSIERVQRKLCEMLHIRISDTKEDGKTRLSHALRGQRVLLVLDDVWNKTDLDWLDVTSSDSGSKTLLTTRNMEVLGSRNAADSTVRMERLSDGDSWALFCQYAFGGVDKIPSLSLHDLVKLVTDECKGLPLALKVIAGALAGQKATEQWQRALNRLKEAEILDEDHEIHLYKRLQLSYDALESLDPGHRGRLQKCFIYFAGFPEDIDVDAEKLVDLWAGEKLLDTSYDEDNPSTDGYFLLGLLIGRSLIELQSADWSDKVNAKKIKCRIPDVLRDLAIYLLRERIANIDCLFRSGRGLQKFPENWLIETRPSILERLQKNPRPSRLSSNATHLSLNDNFLESLPAKLKAPSLEVLLLANCRNLSRDSQRLEILPGFLESFSNLKVLDLERTLIESLPDSLGNLTNLIYLNLSFTELRRLPRGLRKLEKLENLSLINNTYLEPWPFDISCLKSLLSLNTRGCGVVWDNESEDGPGNSVLSCINRRPSGHNSLVSLGSLTLLASLSISSNTRRKQLPSEIASLVNLRHLSVYFPDLLKLPPELHNATSNEPQLSKLQLIFLDNCSALLELPSWLDSLNQLTTLNLVHCRSLKTLPDLHKLQGLRKLDISMCTGLELLPAGFAAKGAFPALTELFMMNCSKLREFPPIEVGAFPQLTDLILTHCAFQTIPSSFRLLPSLVNLDLNLSTNLKSLDDCFCLETTDSSSGSTSAISSAPTSHDHVPYFPNLQKLQLKAVPLVNLPPFLAACPALNMIDLRNNSVALPQNLRLLQEEGKLTILR